MTVEDLKSYAQAMQQYGVRRFEGETGGEDSEEFSIEMDASAFVPAVSEPSGTPLAPAEEEEKCACGCLKVEEHNAQGLCIGKGCPVSLCSPEVKPPAVPV